MLLPFQIETLLQERPWVNWLFMTLCCVTSFAFFYGELPRGATIAMVLNGWGLSGMLGHMLLHVDVLHLAGNMLFLWVFGNAVCGNVGNAIYLFAFPACGLVAATFHNLIDGSIAVGASGAINGVVGFTLAMYPLNRVHIFWFLLIRSGTFAMPAWGIILVWFGFDLWGGLSGGGRTAYWAHIGGLVSGLSFGLLFLQLGWVSLTRWDHRSLLDILKGEHTEYD